MLARMNPVRLLCLGLLAVPAYLAAQQVQDDLDVIDGDNPTLRYGFHTEPSGQIQAGRYYFIDDGDSLKVTLLAYGKTAVPLPVKDYDREAGVLELGWEDKPDRRCRLDRHGDSLFLGNCLEGEGVMPIAIRVADDYDAEWMGSEFPASETDLEIVDRAREMLEQQGHRNMRGDRNCDDDAVSGRVSIFCALYLGSIEVAGVYRHRRPAMQTVREELRQRYPGDYAHQLRDINNRSDVSEQDIVDALDAAQAKLRLELGVPVRLQSRP